MSREDAITLASRTLAVLIMVWTLADISYLPGSIHAFLHYSNVELSTPSATDYYRHANLMSLSFLIVRIIGYSLLEGVGSALMIPPIYILVTVTFPDVKSRARYFGVVSGAGGLGAAAGPLIGGLVTSAISWCASFGLQVLVVAWIIWLAPKINDPARSGPKPRFDLTGAVLSFPSLSPAAPSRPRNRQVRARRPRARSRYRDAGHGRHGDKPRTIRDARPDGPSGLRGQLVTEGHDGLVNTT